MIEGHDAAKGRDGISGNGPGQGIAGITARGHAAGVGVFDHHGGCAFAGREALHRGLGCIEIEQVVVTELFALQLLGAAPSRCAAVPSRCLMGIFPVAQGLPLRQRHRQGVGVAGIGFQLGSQPGADGAVVGGGVLEGFERELAPQLGRNRPGIEGAKNSLVLVRAG